MKRGAGVAWAVHRCREATFAAWGGGVARTAVGHRRSRRSGAQGLPQELGGKAARTAMGHRRRRRGAWGHPQRVPVKLINNKGKWK